MEVKGEHMSLDKMTSLGRVVVVRVEDNLTVDIWEQSGALTSSYIFQTSFDAACLGLEDEINVFENLHKEEATFENALKWRLSEFQHSYPKICQMDKQAASYLLTHDKGPSAIKFQLLILSMFLYHVFVSFVPMYQIIIVSPYLKRITDSSQFSKRDLMTCLTSETHINQIFSEETLEIVNHL